MLVKTTDSWLPPKDLDAGETDFYEIGNLRQYTVVFYYAILLIVGNESAPKSTEQTIFASLVVIMGAIVTAFIFGNMAALMATINKKDSHFQEQIDFVSTTMRSIKLPEEIQNQVIEYLMHCQESPDVQQDIEKFFDILSPSLKNMILHHMYNKIIQEIDIFRDCTDIEIGFIVNNLKTMLFLIDDEIIRQGDFGNRMYFISNGTVDVFLTTEKYQKDLNKKPDRNADDDIDSHSDFSDEENALLRHETRINRLMSGSYFGEIAMVTNLKRTTTVKAVDYTTLAYLTRDNFIDIKKEFPQVYLNFKYNIKKYTDSDFEFRRNMIRNTPYFRNLDKDIIDEIVYLLRPNRYDPGTTIIKYGDITDKIHFLKQGEINVTIPVKTGITQSETHFETLNSGSCFCAFSAFSEDVQQLVNFKAKTSCIVETIDVADLEYIKRTYLQLSDEIKKLKLLIDNKDKSELDFFRYLKPLRKEHKENVKIQVRRKFRAAVKTFTKKYKENKNCLPNALVALQDIMKERRRKQREILHLQRINTIKYLQEKSPLIHPSQENGNGGVNMFINQTINNQFNVQNFNYQPQLVAPSGHMPIPSFGSKEQEELDMLRKMDDEARKEKVKTNQNLSKLLSLIEVHNGTLEEIENKFKREFMDIKANIKKIKQYQQDQERLRNDQDMQIAQQEKIQKEIQKAKKAAPYIPAQVDFTPEPEESKVGKKKSVKAMPIVKKDTQPEQKLMKTNESEIALSKIYPKAEKTSPKDFVQESIDNDDIGLYAIPQSNNSHKKASKDREAENTHHDVKKIPGVSKDKSLKAPREVVPQKPVETPILIDDRREKDLQKMDSNKPLLNQPFEDPNEEIELTDEEDLKDVLPSSSSSQKSDHKKQESESEDQASEPEEEVKKEINQNFKESLINNEAQRKLSEVSFDDSQEDHSQNEQSDDGGVDYEENMPRLNEDGVIVDDKKPKKKKRKIKFKKGGNQNHQEMDAIMREQANKKDKSALAKNAKPKKSYHAYLEHPRMRNQPSLPSPREKKRTDEAEPLGLITRPKKK